MTIRVGKPYLLLPRALPSCVRGAKPWAVGGSGALLTSQRAALRRRGFDSGSQPGAARFESPTRGRGAHTPHCNQGPHTHAHALALMQFHPNVHASRHSLVTVVLMNRNFNAVA